MLRTALVTIAGVMALTGCSRNEIVSTGPGILIDNNLLINWGIPGIYVSFHVTDSLGIAKNLFAREEPIYFRYALVNQTWHDQKFILYSAHPYARFFVMLGTDTLADSFTNMMFAQVVLGGTVKAGDSLSAAWRIDPAVLSLPVGSYMTTASTAIYIEGLGVPPDAWSTFRILPAP